MLHIETKLAEENRNPKAEIVGKLNDLFLEESYDFSTHSTKKIEFSIFFCNFVAKRKVL